MVQSTICVIDARRDEFVVGIFLTNLWVSDVFLSNQKSYHYYLIIFIPVIFILVFVVKISSILNSRLPGPRSRAQSHIVLEYNNENMIFIRLLIANQIALMIIFLKMVRLFFLKWFNYFNVLYRKTTFFTYLRNIDFSQLIVKKKDLV